jgi:DNA-binding SARP family transcriptional activator
MSLRLALLGPPTIEREGGALALPFERRGQLVAYLALKGGWFPRAELAALIWPDQPSKLAYANLR